MSAREHTRAKAIAAYVDRKEPLPLADLAAEFERRGYHLLGFARALVIALEDKLIEADPTWTLRAPR